MRTTPLSHYAELVPAVVIGYAVLRAAVRARLRAGRGKHSARYEAYMRSPEWRRTRKRALARAGYRCEHRGLFGRCPARAGLEAHHLHYRNLGHERDEDLRVLCRPHHVRADVKRRRGRAR